MQVRDIPQNFAHLLINCLLCFRPVAQIGGFKGLTNEIHSHPFSTTNSTMDTGLHVFFRRLCTRVVLCSWFMVQHLAKRVKEAQAAMSKVSSRKYTLTITCRRFMNFQEEKPAQLQIPTSSPC